MKGDGKRIENEVIHRILEEAKAQNLNITDPNFYKDYLFQLLN